MINFIDEKGIKHSAIVECKKKKGVNGEKSLSGTIYTNDKILEGIGRGWRLEFENEKYCLTYVYPIDEGNRIVVEFDAVHEFFFDLNKKVVYTELNGSNTAKAYLDLIFNGSGYSYVIEVNIPAFEKEGFGMRNRLDLFKEFISDTGVEFSVNGKVVRILEKVGSNLSTIVKKGFNLNELRIEKDPGSFITYKKGFGAWHDDDDHSKGRLEVEYLSPLASIYGKLEGDPIVDERYKVASNFETRLKNDVESSYGISVDIDMEDLTKAGYEYEQPHEGDYIMAINKDLGFEQKIRIMSYETSYDTNGNIIDHKVACGSDNIIRKSIKEDDDFRKEIQAGLEGAISTSNKAWVSANGKNAVFEGPDEPTATAIGDTWFQIDGDKKIMRIWNGYEWKPVFNPGEIENKIDQAEKNIAQNIIDIDKSLSKAEQAELDAGFATDLAKDASALANQTAASLVNVKATADQAKADASTSLTNAQNALNKAIKSSVIHYALSANGTTPPATGWQTSNPNPTADQYVWTRTTITLNDNSTIVSYSVGKIGAKGDQGLKGDTGGQGIQGTPGVNAPTITSVVQQFYLSTSKTTQTGGSWLATVPVWSSGKYYWVRVVTTYSNGTNSTSTPVLDNALNDSLVTALEVKTANQNLSTTVTQHATLIEGKANSTTVDAIAGRVTTAEGSISTIAGQVALKANTTDVNTLTGRVTTAEGKITTQAGQIDLKANTTVVNALTGRVSTAEGNITTQAGQIALKANQSVVDTLTGRVTATEASIKVTDGKVTTLTTKTDGNTTSIGLLESSYSGLNSTVTQVKNELDNMEIGGKNLLLNSVFTSDILWKWNIQGAVTGTVDTVNKFEGFDSLKLIFTASGGPVGATNRMYQYNTTGSTTSFMMTSSVYVKADRTVVVGLRNGGTEVVERSTVGTSWTRISQTSVGEKFLLWAESACTLWVVKPKTEKGNQLTDWSPAPEDYTTVTAFSALEQNINGFKTTVANTYADKTTVTQLSTQWTTTTNLVNGHTTQIASLGTDINLRATKTEVAESILADKTIKDTRTTNQLPPWYFTNYPKQKSYEFKQCSVIGLPSSAGTYASVVTEVPWTDASGGTIEQTATATDGVYQRRGTTSWSAWAKVADSSNIVSQINISPESILIASSKIQIKGDTYIDNGVIKTAHIADLAVSGAKIANASIASAKIISLDASKITATSLSAITTNTGTLNVNGWLTTTAENFGFRGTYDYGDNLSGSYNPRWFDGDYRLSHRYLTFQSNVYNVTTSNTRGTFKYYTESFYGPDYLKLRQYPSSSNTTLRNRVDITADKFQITNGWGDNSGVVLNSDGVATFSGRSSFTGGLDIGAPDNIGLRTGRIDAPSHFQTLILNDNRNLGTLTLSYDTSRYISSMDIYNRTYSLAANMYVTPNGVLGRATSARKYKSNITTLTSVYSKAKKVLDIRPVTWYDKRALEEVGRLQIGYGFIADDFHDAGLVEVVSYGSDGQVEGLAYDHISIYHNVILQDHEQQLKRLDSLNTNVIKLVANTSTYGTRLNNLESEVFRLRKRIEELEKIA